MRRFNTITKFAGVEGTNSNKLVVLMEDYAKNFVSDVYGVKMSYDEKYDMEAKGKKINEVFMSEIEARTQLSVATFDGNLGAYGNTTAVAEMASFLQTIMIDTAVPIVMSATNLAQIAEFHYGGYGDVFKFRLEENVPYTASKMGRRQKHIKTQERKVVDKTIATDMYGIGTRVSIPKIVTGEDTMAKNAMLSALGIAVKAYSLTVKKFIAETNLITDPTCVVTNYDEKTLMEKLADNSAKNGEKMVVVGDAIALKDILPADARTRIMLQDEYNTTLGYMSMFNQYPVLAFDVVADASEAGGVLRLPKDKVYGISPQGKLIHVAIGYSNVVTDEMFANNDLAVNTTVCQEIGVELATNKKVVRVDL